MRFSLVAAAAAFPLLASAADIVVQVGAGGLLAFSPTNVTAAVGDTISFQFQGKNHSVTQSTFANPCAIQTTPAQGIDSGFQPVAANATELPQWSFTVNNATAPLWFFCAQTNPAVHCQKGMVFSVNANPDSAKSFAAYQALAMNGAAAAAATSAAGAAASAVGSVVDSLAGAATSAGGSLLGVATSAAGAAAGAAATDAANALTQAAGALTSGLGSILPTGGASNTSAGFALSASPVHFLAAFGLAAVLL